MRRNRTTSEAVCLECPRHLAGSWRYARRHRCRRLAHRSGHRTIACSCGAPGATARPRGPVRGPYPVRGGQFDPPTVCPPASCLGGARPVARRRVPGDHALRALEQPGRLRCRDPAKRRRQARLLAAAYPAGRRPAGGRAPCWRRAARPGVGHRPAARLHRAGQRGDRPHAVRRLVH
jgi:hypothetical protein